MVEKFKSSRGGAENRIWGYDQIDGEALPLEVIKNLENDKVALVVDTQSIESTYTEEFKTNEDGTVIIAPSSGNRIIIKDVFLHANANIGEVKLDFNNGGKKIARLYSSQFHRAEFSNLTIVGDVDQGVELTADADGDKLFVVINYIEVKGE